MEKCAINADVARRLGGLSIFEVRQKKRERENEREREKEQETERVSVYMCE